MRRADTTHFFFLELITLIIKFTNDKILFLFKTRNVEFNNMKHDFHLNNEHKKIQLLPHIKLWALQLQK